MPRYLTDPDAAKYFGLGDTVSRPEMMKAVSRKVHDLKIQFNGSNAKYYPPPQEFFKFFNLNELREKDGAPIIKTVEQDGKNRKVLAWNDNPKIIKAQVEDRPRVKIDLVA